MYIGIYVCNSVIKKIKIGGDNILKYTRARVPKEANTGLNRSTT